MMNNIQSEVKGRYSKRLKGHHDALAPLRRLRNEKSFLKEYLLQMEPDTRPKAVYIHIPFCSKICTFCNMRRYLCAPAYDYHQLIINEIKSYGVFPYIQNSSFDAVYFGGGTPTSLETGNLRDILHAIKEYLPLKHDAEITVETSITELTEDKSDMFLKEGVNRLSIGVQTFCDRGRKLLGRRGSGEDAVSKISKLRHEGFENVSMDLIYNYPGQTEQELEKDLKHISSLDIAGLSFYSLMLREGSALGTQFSDGERDSIDSDKKEYDFFMKIYDWLTKEGFELLELTKMVRPKRDAYKYVTTRYGGGDTLALGAAAGGRLGDFIWMNPFDISEYGAAVESGRADTLQGALTVSMYNYIYRLIGKIQFGNFDVEPAGFWEQSSDIIEAFAQQLKIEGLIVPEGYSFKLTKEGIYWGNNIANELAELLVSQWLKASTREK
ncbi:coproporphyrinogen-III oxidase family protein [Oxobacter pfennigii]|nr:coproporphyrinogen-III oxidase family protein [Oxobacter pfennigii]